VSPGSAKVRFLQAPPHCGPSGSVAKKDQLAALSLVVNAVALWNTRYLSAAVDRLRAQGVPVKDKDEDVARLSFLGRNAITTSTPAQRLRPLGEVPDLPATAS
jgi:hypothetical protein